MDNIVALVSQLGFPIATAVALFWYMVSENRELRKVIENNTLTLTRILEHLSGDES